MYFLGRTKTLKHLLYAMKLNLEIVRLSGCGGEEIAWFSHLKVNHRHFVDPETGVRNKNILAQLDNIQKLI